MACSPSRQDFLVCVDRKYEVCVTFRNVGKSFDTAVYRRRLKHASKAQWHLPQVCCRPAISACLGARCFILFHKIYFNIHPSLTVSIYVLYHHFIGQYFFKHFWSLASMLHAQPFSSSQVSYCEGGWSVKVLKLLVQLFPLCSYHISCHRFNHFPSTLSP